MYSFKLKTLAILSGKVMKKIKYYDTDKYLLSVLAVILLCHYLKIFSSSADEILLTFFASIATLPVIYNAFLSLKEKRISIDLLASIALVVSIMNREWASAVFINLMLTSARLFANYTKIQARDAIKSLLKLRPEKVKVKIGREIIEEAVAKVKINDIIVVELGDRIPVDGVVVSGQGIVDQSSLTGESTPVEKKIRDKVYSSTLNVAGSLVIRAEKVGKDTTFEKIIKLIEQSGKDKSLIQTTADRFASWYLAVTLVGAIILYLISHNLVMVLSVLLVTCADDVAVAVPMAFSAAIGKAAKQGIIFKGGAFLEGITKVKTLIVDKTGTITLGKLKISQVVTFGNFSKDEVVIMAATADYFSQHPIAKAVIEYAKERKLAFNKPTDFTEYQGKGIYAIMKNKKIICGKLSFLTESGIEITEGQYQKIKKIMLDTSKTSIFVGYDKKLACLITLADELRPGVKKTLEELKTLGINKIVMLTGDNENVAKKIAKEAGIDVFHANLFPEDKLRYIKKYQNKKHKVAMIGDGVNDAASLALADIGIAMGVIGSDVAIEAADIALMKDEFNKIPEAIHLGNTTVKISQQDFWIWGVVNVVGFFLALSGTIGPEEAAAFNFITDFFPIFNSLRLFRYNFPSDI